MLVPGFRITQSPVGSYDVTVHNAPLSSHYIAWPSSNPGGTWTRIPQPTLEEAVLWAALNQKDYIAIGYDGEGQSSPHRTYYYLDTGARMAQPAKRSRSEPQAQVVDLRQLISAAKQQPLSFDHGYISMKIVGDGGKEEPMKSYFMKGAQPPGSAWKSPVMKRTSNYPALNCLDACRALYKPWAAIKKAGDTVECWCGANADVSGMTSQAPTEPGYIQILHISPLIETSTVRIYANGHPSAEFRVKPQPYGYVEVQLKQPASAEPRTLLRSFTAGLPAGVAWYPMQGQDGVGCSASCYTGSYKYSAQRSSSDGTKTCRCGHTRPGSQAPHLSHATSPPDAPGMYQITELPIPTDRTSYPAGALVIRGTYMNPRMMSYTFNGALQTPQFAKKSALKSADATVTLSHRNKPDKCVLECYKMRFSLVAVTRDMCMCLKKPDGLALDTDPNSGGVSVFDLRPLQPKSQAPPGGGVSISVSGMPHGYYRVFVNNKELPMGFASTQPPDSTWKSQGDMSVSGCLETCHKQQLMYMLVQSHGGSSSCWCAASGDVSSLDHNYPSQDGRFQVFDISPMSVGEEQQFGVTGASPIEVKSKHLGNNYYEMSARRPDVDHGFKPLTSYFTDTAPSSVLWYPMDKPQPSAPKCMAYCASMRFSFGCLQKGGPAPCQCGQLKPGQQLGLSNTNVPTHGGSMQVVQLLEPSPVQQPHSSDGSYTPPVISAEWMSPTICRAQLDGVPQPLKFIRATNAAAANGISMTAPGENGGQCIANCMQLHFKLVALSKSQCFCLEGGDVHMDDTFSDGADWLTIIDTSSRMPKPDGTGMMGEEYIPVTNYVRFVLGHELQQSGFTAAKVDPSAGPPGTWTPVGQKSSIADCAVQCAMHEMNYGAVLPLAKHSLQCWCSKSVDMASFDKTIPHAGGKAQIYDFTKAIQRMSSG